MNVPYKIDPSDSSKELRDKLRKLIDDIYNRLERLDKQSGSK